MLSKAVMSTYVKIFQCISSDDSDVKYEFGTIGNHAVLRVFKMAYDQSIAGRTESKYLVVFEYMFEDLLQFSAFIEASNGVNSTSKYEVSTSHGRQATFIFYRDIDNDSYHIDLYDDTTLYVMTLSSGASGDGNAKQRVNAIYNLLNDMRGALVTRMTLSKFH